MIAAFARAARVLVARPSSGEYLDTAIRAAAFIRSTLWSNGTLLRRYRDGEAAIQAYAEDYAYLIWGLLELFQASGDATWLEWALALQAATGRKILGSGRWWLVQHDRRGSDGAASAKGRLRRCRTSRELCRGVECTDPGASHRTTTTCARRRNERWHVTVLVSAPPARTIPMMLCALSAWHAGQSQVVIAGDWSSAQRICSRKLHGTIYRLRSSSRLRTTCRGRHCRGCCRLPRR